MTAEPLLRTALQRPQTLETLSLAEWDRLISHARQTRLLARIAFMIDAQGGLDSIPQAPRAHLRSAMMRSEAQHADLTRELDLIGRAVAATGARPILVGGTAYVVARSLPAMGRELTAVRLIVPTEQVPQVEAALMAHGWTTIHHDPDQRQFYRRWMNGPAPFVHLQRHSVVLLRDRALTGRFGRALTAAALDTCAEPLNHDGRFAVPSPVDLALCAMAQLYSVSNPDTVWRDLSDLDLLLRQLGRGVDFWPALLPRAQKLSMMRPLRHGFRWCAKMLGTPFPGPVFAAATRGLSWPIDDAIWASALDARCNADPGGHLTRLARSAFVYRALRWRMPTLAVFRHLASRSRVTSRSLSTRDQ